MDLMDFELSSDKKLNNDILKFNEVLKKVELPKGCLFYPCCGGDTFEPINMFKDKVEKFNFADINKVVLPNVECGIETSGGREGRIGEEERKRIGIFSKDEIKAATQITHIKNYDIGRALDKNFKFDVGSVLIRGQETKETWFLNDKSNRSIEIKCYKLDGMIAFLLINKISVFYYRGDSIGEGGSGQWWLGPILFNRVLNKLANGGLIITDGSNPHPCYRYAEWNNLWNHNNEPKDFEYKNRRFTCLGLCSKRYRRCYAWRVDRI